MNPLHNFMINKSTPLVSVIMSTYNNIDSLDDSIKSILNQTYENIELLVLDDGSTDKTFQFLNKFTDKRLTVFNNYTNIGLTKSLNKLISLSKGKYLARQDADDISLPTRIEQQVHKLENSKYKTCTTRALVANNNKKIPGFSFFLPSKLVIKVKNPYIHGTLMIEKSCMNLIGGYDEKFYYAQDYKLFSDLTKNKIPIFKIKKPLYLLNMENNISTNFSSKQNYFAECVKKNIEPDL